MPAFFIGTYRSRRLAVCRAVHSNCVNCIASLVLKSPAGNGNARLPICWCVGEAKQIWPAAVRLILFFASASEWIEYDNAQNGSGARS